MKRKKNCLILAVVTGISCIPTLGDIELPLQYGKPFLIGRAYRELAGIKGLYFAIILSETEAEKDSAAWGKLKDKAESKLKEAGINISSEFYNGYEIQCPQLRVDIDMLELKDQQQNIVRVQTSLARVVYLMKDSSCCIKADVWRAKPVMQEVSVQDMSAKITDVVLQQVNTFISACNAANVTAAQQSDAKGIALMDQQQNKVAVQPPIAEYEYVASKNSKVFHKSECPWAKRIKPENLIGYKSRDDAIEKGKKPCGWCKP